MSMGTYCGIHKPASACPPGIELWVDSVPTWKQSSENKFQGESHGLQARSVDSFWAKTVLSETS